MAKSIIIPQEIDAAKFIAALAEELKKIDDMKAPKWTDFVKTSPSKMRPPENEDWWYVRAASILRQVYIKGVVGVSKLRTKYGSRKKRGVAPEKFKRSGGKIIRTILQQSEKSGLTEKVKEKNAGRRLTKKGKELLEKLAQNLKNK
ncbi:30S ribosomal protein S19e [Candidatus Pacearchaeota archaeon]|nr:30S ribosomal protein S19e [Candidatus Pacearchaeota archaeon]